MPSTACMRNGSKRPSDRCSRWPTTTACIYSNSSIGAALSANWKCCASGSRTASCRARTAISNRSAPNSKAYFAGRTLQFRTPITLEGSPFQQEVWNALRAIAPGTTRSYGEIAATIGRHTAVRAVGRANGDNKLAIIIPCHRVIGANGTLTGYGGGLWRKAWLLEHERTHSTVPAAA